MKIIFFGIPDLGLMCLNAFIERKKDIVAIVLPKANKSAYNVLSDVVRLHNIPILTFENSLKDADFIEKFKSYNPDIAFVCAYDHKIPEELLKIPTLGFINCHPSLLPHYRGGNPYFHVITNNETKTGVTIHYMDKTFDTGDIISQCEMDIMADETFGTLFSRLNEKSVEMVLDVADKLEKNGELPRIPQDFSESYKTAPTVSPEKGDIFIDWKKDAVYIERFIRACNPIYGALCYFRNCAVKIWSAEFIYDKKEYAPGIITKVSPDKITIGTGKGLIVPKTIQVGYFLITDIKDFIRRLNPQAGEKFF